jgi:hypothetical protein
VNTASRSILNGIRWALYPHGYIPSESMGDALWFSGQRIAGAAIVADWVEKNPDHEMGRRRLLNMQGELSLEK